MLRSALLALVLAVAVTTSLVEGPPQRLPGVALGSPVLLHVERAAALVGLVLAVGTVLVRVRRGEVPTQLSVSGIGYEAQAADEARAVTDRLMRDVEELDDRSMALEGR